MNIVYIHSSYKPNDLIGQWFSETKEFVERQGGKAFFAIKFIKGRKMQPYDIMVGGHFSSSFHRRMFDYFGLQDMFSWLSTKKFLRKLDAIAPDVIHFHVVNDMFLNMGLLCRYVNRNKIKIIWTFHDARVLTGNCPYPEYVGCSLWQDKCNGHHCKNTFIVPKNRLLYLLGITHNYRKRTIGHIDNLTIVTPSKWMASLVAKSYLNSKSCVVINNGIDLNMFHPVKQNVRELYQIPLTKTILLSVGNPIWQLKGSSFLRRLLQDLPDKYYFIWIGCLDNDIKILEGNKRVLALSRVDRQDLIKFYTAADLFVNPTLADNFPTVNLESQACGTPVVAFDSDGTGETVDPNSGVKVPKGDYHALYDAILHFNFKNAQSNSIFFAQQFDQKKVMPKYFKLYKKS